MNSILLLFSTAKTLELGHHLYREKLKELLNAEMLEILQEGWFCLHEDKLHELSTKDEVGIKKLFQL